MQCVFISLYHYHTAQSACADDQTVFLNFTFMYSSLLKYFEMTVIVIWCVAISYQYIWYAMLAIYVLMYTINQHL